MPTNDDDERPPAHLEDEAELQAEADLDDEEVERSFTILINEALRDFPR